MKDIEIFEPEFWKNTWKKANCLSSISIKKSNEQKWINFWNEISNTYCLRNKTQKDFILKVVNLLQKEKIISKESEVLDIGCGPGSYALPLAKKIKKIVAIDPAEEMLQAMMKEAKKRKIINIIPVCCRWEDYNPTQKFDLVFASLSPAIRNTENLVKMNNTSCRYVCIITYFKTNEFKFRDELWQKIMKKPFYSYGWQIIFPFNFLWTSGFAPCIHFFDFEYEVCENMENLVMQYKNYFSIFTKIDKNIKNQIYNYFKNYSKEGIIKNVVKKEIVIMWWKVR